MESGRLDEILSGCRRGKDSAWRALYDEHFDFVYRTARKLGTPEAEVEDVVHEVFIVVMKKLDTFKYGRFATWLYRICSNVASDRHRKRRVRRRFALLGIHIGADDPITPAQVAERRSSAGIIERVFERMSDKNREVIALYELEGLSGEEIAERIGCPVGTVWTRLHHGRKQFRKVAYKLGYRDLFGEER